MTSSLRLIRRFVALGLIVAAAAARAAGVPWTYAVGDAQVDAAFARARAEARPLLLYWGASCGSSTRSGISRC